MSGTRFALEHKEDVMPQMMAQVQRTQHDVAGLALGALIGSKLFAVAMLCLDYISL